MKKINPPRLVTVAVFTTVTIIFWIFFSVYNILTSDAEINIEQRLLKPIDPTLNTQVLNDLPAKTFYDSSSTQKLNVLVDDDTNNETENEEVTEPTPTGTEETEEETEESESESDTTSEPSPTVTTSP